MPEYWNCWNLVKYFLSEDITSVGSHFTTEVTEWRILGGLCLFNGLLHSPLKSGIDTAASGPCQPTDGPTALGQHRVGAIIADSFKLYGSLWSMLTSMGIIHILGISWVQSSHSGRKWNKTWNIRSDMGWNYRWLRPWHPCLASDHWIGVIFDLPMNRRLELNKTTLFMSVNLTLLAHIGTYLWQANIYVNNEN